MLKVRFDVNDELLNVLRSVESILSVNENGNILKFVKFANVNNKLEITAINPVTRLYYLMDVDGIEGDSALYDYKTLIALLNVIKGTVVIEDGNIKSTKCAYKIPCEGAKDYPSEVLPDIAHNKINAKEFIEALENTSAAADKVSSGIMGGVHIGEGKLIGCDSKRVAIEVLDLDENIQNITLPRELIKEVLKLPFNSDIMIAPWGEGIIISDGSIKIVSARLAGKYPLVERILPKEVKHTIKIKNKDLYDALVCVAPVIDETSKECYLEYDKNNMLIYVNNGLESAKTSISIDSNVNEAIKVRFNIQFLLDMLKANGEVVTITTYSDNIGYKFTSSNKGFQYIMPLIN